MGQIHDIPLAREKLIHSILFFTEQMNNSKLGKLKMLKLLYLFDFEHFRQVGRPALGLKYQAWKYGPVAYELNDEFHDPKPDMAANIKIENRTNDLGEETSGLKFKALKKYNKKYFSRREVWIMERIVEFCRELRSEDMSQFTHGKNMPWRKIWLEGNGDHQIIPYDLSLDSYPLMIDKKSITKEELQELSEIDDDFRAAFSTAN